MDISLTDFVDFTTKTGASRVGKVRDLKRRGDYDPATDFWRALREGIVSLHRAGQMSASNLDALVGRATERKLGSYLAAASGYKKLVARKKAGWFDPTTGLWRAQQLGVRVNPELGLTFDGRRLLAKLYMKKDAVSRAGVQAVLAMMELELRPAVDADVEFAVVDAQAGKLLTVDARWSISDMETSLLAEAMAFQEIWRRI